MTEPTPQNLAAGSIHVAAPEMSPIDERTNEIRDRLIRGAALLDLPPRQWIVSDWLPLDALVVIYGDPKAGKSLYAWNLALELASGGRWLGPLPRPYRVLWVAAEKIADLGDRARAWSGERQIPERLIIANDRPNLITLTDSTAYERIIADEKIEIVIIDTYAAATSGLEENATDKTSQVMTNLDKMRRATGGGSVIVIHHSAKNAAKGSGKAMRGSSVFLGAADLTIEIGASDSTSIQATVTESNGGPKPIPEHYKIVPVAVGDSTSPRSAPRLEHSGAPIVSGTWIDKIVGLWADGGYFDGPATRKQIEDALRDQGETISRATVDRHLRAATNSRQMTKSGTEARPLYGPATAPMPGLLGGIE